MMARRRLPVSLWFLVLLASPWRAGAGEQDAPPAHFLGEIVFRYHDTLFLARGLIQPGTDLRWPPLPVVGYDDRGERVSFSDPGHTVLKRQRTLTQMRDGKSVRTTPPDYTTWHNINFRRRDPADERPTEIGLLLEGDMMTPVPCPAPGKPAVVLFGSAAYRVERLTAEQAAAFQPLADDPEFYKRRVTAIREELIATRRDEFAAEPQKLEGAAVLFCDERLIDMVRAGMNELIAGPPDNLDASKGEHHLLSALSATGGPADVQLLDAAWDRHPSLGSSLVYRVPGMARRIGVRHARDLLLRLLAYEQPADARDLQPLLKVYPKTPLPEERDLAVIELASAFDLDPRKFNMTLLHERYVSGTSPQPTEAEIEQARRDLSHRWIFADAEDREKGLELMRKWVRDVGRD